MGSGRGMVLGRWAMDCGLVSGGVLSGFARIFGYLVVTGGLGARRCLASSAVIWSGGWVGWRAEVAGLVLRGACFSNSKNFQKSERRLSFRLCRSRRAASAGVAGGSGRRVLGRGRLAQLSRAAMAHDCARSPSRGMSTFESRPKTRLGAHPLLCNSRR